MSDLAKRMRLYIGIRGGPAKDEHGKYVGGAWPMMLEAASELESLQKILVQINKICHVPSHGQNAYTHYGRDFDKIRELTKPYMEN